MKNTSLFLTSVLAGLVAITFPTHAADWTLTSGTGNWTDTANWSGGILPVASGTANLTTTVTAHTTANLTDNSSTAGVLNMASGGTTYYLRILGNGNQLTMDNGGSQAQINIGVDGPTNQNLIQNVDIRMTAGGLALTKNSSQNHNITGAISSNAAGNQTLVLTAKGSGNMGVSSAITDGAGKVAVIVDALSGRVNLSGNTSTFTGGLLIRNGYVSGANFGAGLVTLGDATTTMATWLVSGSVITNDIQVSSASSQSASLIYSNTNSSSTLSGAIELQKEALVEVASGNLTATISGNVSGAGELKTTNTGTASNLNLTLSGNNSAHTGGVSLTAGATSNSTLILGHAKALGTGTFTLSSGGGKVLLDSSVANLVLTTNNAIAMNTSFTYNGTGGNNLNLGTGTVTFASNKAITVNAGVLTIGGAVVGGAKLEKLGAGVLALNGANTYSSDTDVLAGTLRGTGSVANDLYVRDTATLEAGDGGIGTFTVGGMTEFHAGSTFKIELNTTAATYDQLITNGLWIDSTVTINFSDLGGSAWGLGTKITLIDNTSGGAISGTFSGYAEGYEFVLGANTFKTTYLGGTGNDFALEVVPEPATVALMLAALSTLVLTRRRRQS